MGATLPLAAEIAQRELKVDESRLVSRLYFVNTTGAVVGSLIGVGSLVPRYGQQVTLSIAASLNLMAAAILFFDSNRVANGSAIPREGSLLRTAEFSTDKTDSRFTGFAILAFGFGCCALWYEMFLYRAIALRYQPLPLVFSAVLTGFLLYWSLGALVTSLKAVSLKLTYVIFLCTISGVVALLFYVYDEHPFPLNTTWNETGFIFLKGPYFLPCFFFGMLFGMTLQKAIFLWGRDVGRLSAWNTAGSCSGILLATFIGYELDLNWMLAVQWLLLLALGGVNDKINNLHRADTPPSFALRNRVLWLLNIPTIFFALLALATIITNIATRYRAATDGSAILYGRDGVIMIDQQKNLVWDGLWHSRLSTNNNHIGTYNWALAVDPVLAHPTGRIHDALVVGMGSGTTAATLAKYESIKVVDVYDINQTLKRVLELYPQGTLHVAENPKINIIWQDGRTGLALQSKKYDVITQQPLYLKQAGASILLSKEYFQLVSKRLKENGVFCVYANGTPEQALAVRQTAFEVFPHMLVLHKGYTLILSSTPLDFSQTRLEALVNQKGALWNEIRQYSESVGKEKWQRYTEPSNLVLANSNVAIHDNFPIVEYPVHLRRILEAMDFKTYLPQPSLN
jgi:spermidine synthase